MKNWLVRLVGDEFDLQELPELLASPNATVLKEDGQYYLKSTDFDTQTGASDILKIATQILEAVNGAAKLHLGSFRTVQIADIVEISTDGKRQHFVFLEGSLHARSKLTVSATVIKSNGTVEQESNHPTQIESWVALARHDKNVADALHFFNEPNWFNLYKIYEIIKDDVCGEQKIIQNSWVTKTNIKLFTQTAQSRDVLGDNARHASKKYKPPQKPMSLPEAKSLIKILLQNWLRSK
jgi:hypothetical protein